jgi:pimeloyl-ACP methyl ester carboxylesterase
MHYVKIGNGPLLFLLHGWAETWYEWREVMQILASHFTMIAPDLRGLGLSEKTPSGYDKQTLANDVAALIQHLGKESVTVVGHDMGGKVAYVLGLLYPKLVSHLVLVDCIPPGDENMDPSKGGGWHFGFHMAEKFPEMLTKGRELEYLSAQIDEWIYKKEAISSETRAEYAKYYSSPGGMTAAFNYYRALLKDAKFLAANGDKKFLMPILTVSGQYGVANNLYQAVLKRSNDVTGVIAEGSGHFVPEEDPEFLAEQIIKFLSKKNLRTDHIFSAEIRDDDYSLQEPQY